MANGSLGRRWNALSYESDRMVMQIIMKWKLTKLSPLTGDWDRSVGSIAWAKDSKSLIVTAREILDVPAFQIDLATGKATRLTGEGSVGNVIPMNDGAIIYTKKNLQAPSDVYRRSANGEVTQLTNINGNELAEIDKVSIQRFDFKGADGDQVWGQIIKPAGIKGKPADGVPRSRRAAGQFWQ